MDHITVTWKEGVAFQIAARGFQIIADQPQEEGGRDLGPSPVELFIASLGSCIGYYMARYCERHDIPRAGLRVDLEWTDAENPHRIGEIRVYVRIPTVVPESKRPALIRVAEGCTVHHTLTHPPRIIVDVEAGK